MRVSGLTAESWDPFSGERIEVHGHDNGKVTAIDLKLAPYESRVLIFRRGATAAKPAILAHGRETVQDVSTDWKVTFEGTHKTALLARLQSWTENEDTRFYSGRVVYEKQIGLPQDLTAHSARATLDFGPGSPVAATGSGAPGMRALLEGPVRESALVYVNGQLAGSVWHPPYQVDISQCVRPGANSLRIVVANLAINEMAGRSLPDYRLLNLRYGTRFSPQGFENLQPLPAGILGPLRIVLR
jgi:hypothetical protein